MVKKGESKTYFPTEIDKDSLKEIPKNKDPKENDRLKSERSQYIVDTRTALGLPTDASDKNVYDAEVVKAVKEIQKKSGLKETGLFDKETATKYQESLKKEVAAKPGEAKSADPKAPEAKATTPGNTKTEVQYDFDKLKTEQKSKTGKDHAPKDKTAPKKPEAPGKSKEELVP